MASVSSVCVYAGNPPVAHAAPIIGPMTGDKLTNQYTLDVPTHIAATLVVAAAHPTYSLSIGKIAPKNGPTPATLHSVGAAVNGVQTCIFTV